MDTIGIVCEYNPFHLGHSSQIQIIRREFGNDCAVVCAMSGNYVQRGEPAIFEKSIRAASAIRAGADLVLELPVPVCLSSAEGFAAGGVQILSGLCNTLSFGTETMSRQQLWETASSLNSPSLSEALHRHLRSGCSFPAARQMALQDISNNLSVPLLPNDILAVEYCRAILSQDSKIRIFPVIREANYHAQENDTGHPSATSLRRMIYNQSDLSGNVPASELTVYRHAAVHRLQNAEHAILYRLRTMNESDYASLPFGGEGLWRRLMHVSRTASSCEEILSLVKTKRYTWTRIARMLLCSFLQITESQLQDRISHVRILAFNDKGRSILRNYHGTIPLINAGARAEGSYCQIEDRCEQVYPLFADNLYQKRNAKVQYFSNQ